LLQDNLILTMKTAIFPLFLIFLFFNFPMSAQQILAPNRTVIGYFEEGRVYNAARLPVGSIDDRLVRLPSRKVIGRIKGDEILGPNNRKLARFKEDRLEAPNHAILFYLKRDRLLRPNKGVSIFFKGLSPRDAALCWFFFGDSLK
jgi:hypothetical protein